MNTNNTVSEFSVSKYRISTITITGSINCDVNLKALFNAIDLENYPNIQYIEHGDNKYNHNCKGSKLQKKIKNKPKMKRFDNQLTLIYDYCNFTYNIKLFKNGNVQMTGVKSVENGEKMIDELIKFLKHIHDINMVVPCDNIHINNVILHQDQVINLKNTNYNVRLINSDFKVNFEIKRDALYKILLNVYKINCTYEPCIYPGVKIAYYVNGDKNQDGVCNCEVKCCGKKNICKRITIAIFQSGCVIITGANNVGQINMTYSYVSKVLKTHMNEIIRRRLVLPTKKN